MKSPKPNTEDWETSFREKFEVKYENQGEGSYFDGLEIEPDDIIGFFQHIISIKEAEAKREERAECIADAKKAMKEESGCGKNFEYEYAFVCGVEDEFDSEKIELCDVCTVRKNVIEALRKRDDVCK